VALDAGRRDRRIVFETGEQIRDPDSGAISYGDWESYFEVWAHREDLAGSELFRAQQIAAKVTTRYTIPYPHGKDLSPRESLRLVDQGRIYDVTFIRELGVRGRAGIEVLAFARAEQDSAA
jgi:SPP1 family predicted phage head-tail adaptor